MISLTKHKPSYNAALRVLRHSLILILIAFVLPMLSLIAGNTTTGKVVLQLTGIVIGVIWGLMIIVQAEARRQNEKVHE